MDSYFQVRDAERTAWFTSQEVRNIADVAAMVTKALDAAGGEGETSVQALADHGGISLRPISADRFSAQVRDLFCEPPGKLLAELDLKDDTFYCASWVPREEHCVAVSGMISRLLGVYELAMVERLEKHLDLDRFCNEIWDHLHVSFVAPRMERQSERWGPRDRPETGRGALYKRAADLVATYEELLLVPDEACVTHYLGDLGIHIFKYDAAQEQIQNAYEKALSVMEMDDAEFQAEKQFVYRGEIISAMRDRLLVGELKPGETVLFVGTEPYGGPGDFELRGGVVEAVNPSERTCSVRGEFFTMHDVPLHYVLGRYDTSVEGEHYGFPHVRPLFGENRDLAGQYLREAEANQRRAPCAALCAASTGGGTPCATHAREKPALRLCAASTRNAWRPKWAGGPGGRKVCGIKPCYHGLRHRPAMRAGDAVSGRFQPPFRIFLEGPMLSLFERCYQICYQAGGKCRSSSSFHGFKCVITANFTKWRLLLNAR